MKRIDERKLHRLTWRETLRLCVMGIRHRLLRSALTLAVVALAVAFFMFMLSESVFLRSAGAVGAQAGRQMALLCISFLVCMVGVANAMLMSIAERIREIATMKCLGATNRFILVQFMMEAALQGICGGALGVVVGFLAALVRNVLILGGQLFADWPMLAIGGRGIVALLTGVVLAVLASIYPAWSASRMAPMEAMRVE